jgi:hypothetical protein
MVIYKGEPLVSGTLGLLVAESTLRDAKAYVERKTKPREGQAILIIKGAEGTLTAKLRGKTTMRDLKVSTPDWGVVMSQANREVEKLGVFVQVWQGGTGDGIYQTALGTKPIPLD